MTDAQKAKMLAFRDRVRTTEDDAVIVGGTTLALILRMIVGVCDV